MANFTFNTLKEWGLDTFCVQDYAGYIHNQHNENSNVPLVKTGEYFAGMVLFDGDTKETVISFLRMCKVAGVSILRIDFSNITLTDEGEKFIKWVGDSIKHELGAIYKDLESYEFSFAWGLQGDCRGVVTERFNHGDFVQVED